MAFRHGIYVNEVPTSIVPTLTVATPTVVVGCAPLHLATNPAPVNTPVLCSTYADYVAQFGWSGDTEAFTCEEAAMVHFQLYNVRPIVVVNVLDPATHFKAGTKTVSGASNPLRFKNSKVWLDSLTVKSGETDFVKDVDYTAAFDDTTLVITVKSVNKLVNDSVTLSYNLLDASKVTATDIIGGVDAATGKNKGIECINDVYPKYGVLPGSLIAPKYSTDSEVAAVMKSKVTNICGCFNTIAICDIATSTVRKYSDVYDANNNNNLVDKNLIVCYPMVTLGGTKYHMSTHVAALMGRIDSDEGGDVPFISPSNHTLQCDGLCLADGTEVLLPKDAADYLNSVGIVTGLNLNGWRLFGNRTSIYPSTTDPAEVFIPVRRMISYLGNTIILTFFSFVDRPITKRLIESVETSCQLFLNGLSAEGAILGGSIEFTEEDNPLTELLDGKIKFTLRVGFAVPAESITFDVIFDPTLYQSLFS